MTELEILQKKIAAHDSARAKKIMEQKRNEKNLMDRLKKIGGSVNLLTIRF